MQYQFKRLNYLSLLFLFIFPHVLYSQDYITSVQKIGIEDGLSNHNAICIHQDKKGFIWIGTNYGLNRYDGVDVKVYTQEENGLCGNVVYVVNEDEKGNLWLVCRETGQLTYCLTVFNPIKEEFYTLEEYTGKKSPFNGTYAFCSISNYGNVVFQEYKSIVNQPIKSYNYFEYDGQEYKKLFPNFNNNIFHGLVFKLKPDLYSLQVFDSWSDTANFTHLFLNAEGNILDSVFCGHKGAASLHEFHGDEYCTICRHSEGGDDVYQFIIGTEKIASAFFKNKSKLANNISYYKNKIYQLNSDSLTVFNINGEIEIQVPTPVELEFPLHVFYIDDQENIWFGNKKFIYHIKVSKSPFKLEQTNASPRFRIRGIAQSNSGDLYMGGANFFLHRNSKNAWHQKGNFRGIKGIISDSSGLWIGVEEGKMYYESFKGSNTQEYHAVSYPKGYSFGVIWMPHIAKDGRVWAGTSEGLYFVADDQQFLPFDSTGLSELAQSVVYAFHENNEGTWLSTSSGLYLVDLNAKKILAHYSSKQEGDAYIPAEHLAHLHEDEDGVFWIATKGKGLIKFNPRTKAYQQYTQKGAGLSHNVLYAVYGDDFNNLWISSQRGLMRFNKKTEVVKIYLEQDGLPEDEFNTIAHYKGGDGELYFGGQNGMIHFHPNDLQAERKIKASFVITDFYKEDRNNNNQINLTEELVSSSVIRFRPNDKFFNLKFALLDYQNSEIHQYSYQIIGYDNDWNYQSENSIKVNALPYGNYQLKLRAKSANGGNWIDYPNIIQIQVIKPFYWQTWFLAILAISFLAIVYAIVRWRIRILEERKAELEIIVDERTAQIKKDKEVIEGQAEELRTLDKVKSHFFANISHELRTPLTLILGPLSYILNDSDAWEQVDLREQLTIMQRNGKSLMDLIEEILDLSKLEANKLELEEEGTPVNQFFEYIFAVFEPQFESKGLDYELVSTLSDQLVILLDRKKLEKVVNNFLSNALKFTNSGDKITMFITEQKGCISIRVSDTGKGVHPNDLPFIFERFYQSKQADQKLHGGTGIGLALVQEFAHLMQGSVRAESVLGEGSHFCFEFPKKEIQAKKVLKQHAIQILEDDPIASIGTDFTILVVEDNLDMRNFVCSLLKKKYKNVLEAKDGAEGLQILKEHGAGIQLVVSDVMMPNVDGLMMLKEIKSNEAWNKIPVIMLTALAAERDKLNALTIGVDDYLTKPFSVSELLIRVQNILYNYHQRMLWQQEEAPETEEVEKDLGIKNSEADKKWVDEVEKIVLNSFESDILNVEELAALVFLSKKQLTRKMKVLIGMTPARFIREIQLNRTRKELENGTALSVKEVAYNNGFDSPSSFATAFKKHFGKSPSEYLK